MRKLVILVLSVLILFNWLLTVSFSQWFSSQSYISPEQVEYDNYSFNGSKNSYENIQNAINWLLALYWLYASYDFITSPNVENFKKILFVGISYLIVNLFTFPSYRYNDWF